jgi:putative multicomponent Na+:H+ antiporter subunit B
VAFTSAGDPFLSALEYDARLCVGLLLQQWLSGTDGGAMTQADSYIYVITALLPLVASMVILQGNPFHALVIRGILGAIAALVYASLGAADVALTEALVGTLLAITLYAVTVRSSLVLHLGVLKEDVMTGQADPLSSRTKQFQSLLDDLRTVFRKHYLRVELISYPDRKDLNQALMDKEVHATCAPEKSIEQDSFPQYMTTTRLRRIYEILQTELMSSPTCLIDIPASDQEKS